MQKQLYKLDERRPCQECGKSLVYGTLGWLHVRKPARPHAPVVTEQSDPIYTLTQRVAELEEIIKAKDERINVLLAASRELAEKVRR